VLTRFVGDFDQTERNLKSYEIGIDDDNISSAVLPWFATFVGLTDGIVESVLHTVYGS
jgi:hypothetical protein